MYILNIIKRFINEKQLKKKKYEEQSILNTSHRKLKNLLKIYIISRERENRNIEEKERISLTLRRKLDTRFIKIILGSNIILVEKKKKLLVFLTHPRNFVKRAGGGSREDIS